MKGDAVLTATIIKMEINMKRGHEVKTTLTPHEKIRVAAAHDVLGVAQHHLAFIFGVNQGRIAEAIDAIRVASGLKVDSDDDEATSEM